MDLIRIRGETHSIPARAVLGLDLVLVADPVSVPSPESSRVVDANGVDSLDLEPGTLELVGKPAQWARGISTGEDVLVHEQTPDEVLILPGLTETSDLEEEDTIIVKHVVDLGEERTEVTDADVLGHLKAGDLVVAALGNRDITVVHAQDLALLLWNASLAKGTVAPGRLVATEGDTSNLSTVVDTGKAGKGTPAAADVEKALARLEVNLFAHNSQLVVLELLEGLLRFDVRDDTRGVNHAGTKEPAVEVITAVVMITNLLFICTNSQVRTRLKQST